MLRGNIHALEYKRQGTGSKCIESFLFVKSRKSAFLIRLKLMTAAVLVIVGVYQFLIVGGKKDCKF